MSGGLVLLQGNLKSGSFIRLPTNDVELKEMAHSAASKQASNSRQLYFCNSQALSFGFVLFFVVPLQRLAVVLVDFLRFYFLFIFHFFSSYYDAFDFKRKWG